MFTLSKNDDEGVIISDRKKNIFSNSKSSLKIVFWWSHKLICQGLSKPFI